jgi:5'-AMP-activated protein kinase catalytic alpha subunit
MVCGYLPFEDNNTTNLYRKILSASYNLPKFISGDAVDLIRGLLTIDPKRRFTIPEIRRHPWF